MMTLLTPPNSLWAALAITAIIQAGFFAAAAALQTDKVTDLSYGLTFVILAAIWLAGNPRRDAGKIIIGLAIIVWGLRLMAYLFRRILVTQKDDRFDGVRENPRRFAVFWFFQGLTIWVIMLPSIAALSRMVTRSLNDAVIAGAAIWLAGLVIEAVADSQKYRFKLDRRNAGKWIDSGLWRYSRHPNYFGEMLCWWGLFLAAAPYLSGWYWLTMVGPLFITMILLFVSGIPPLERRYDAKYANDAAYQEYKRGTSLVVLWPRRGSGR